jgi:putative ABC transport system ATP-binding protein
LADEPTGNLDSQRGMEIVNLMRQICHQEKTTIVQVTHDREAAEASDTIFTLHDGQISGRRSVN